MNIKILPIFLIVIFLLSAIGFGVVFALNSNKINMKNENLIQKVEQEIKVLEDKIIAMMNKLNNISFLNALFIEEISCNNQVPEIDWTYMKTNVETIYTILPTFISDLNMLEINSDGISNFSNILDQTTLSIKNEDKFASINNLANLYAFLPNYRSQLSSDKQKINIDYTINFVLNGYAFLEQNNWDEVNMQLTSAINCYLTVMEKMDEDFIAQNRVSKAYILLNELKNCVSFQDKDLFYMKYYLLIEELQFI